MTITRWLKQGSGIWCDYNAKEERFKTASKSGKASGKSVEIFKNNISLGIFPSAMELERQSEKIFGIKLGNSAISSVCRNDYEMYKGYTFKYADNLKEVANF